jgi:hypothetical protein
MPWQYSDSASLRGWRAKAERPGPWAARSAGSRGPAARVEQRARAVEAARAQVEAARAAGGPPPKHPHPPWRAPI